MLFNMDQIPILAIFLVVKALYPGERLWRWGVPRWIINKVVADAVWGSGWGAFTHPQELSFGYVLGPT